MANELYHYGVPGMKWGVRRTPDYKDYKKRRRVLTTQADWYGRWDQAYNKTVNKNEKRLSRKIEKDVNKNGKVSDKTQKLMNAHEELKKDASDIRTNKKISEENLQKFIDNSIKTFGKKNVKDIKTYTRKGEKYIKNMFTDSAIYTVEKRKRRDINGNSYYEWVPVRTNYYVAFV